MNSPKTLLVASAALFLAVSAFAGVQYVETIPPARHPELVYWFWQSNTLANAQYLRDVQKMAAQSPYTIAFFTERDNLDFYDFDKMHEPFAQTVREAHKHNLKIGLQLWEFWSVTKPRLSPETQSRLPLPIDQAQALVTEGEVVLDSAGHANYSVGCDNARAAQPFHSEILKVFAFRKTGEGYYAANSLTDITASAKAVGGGTTNLTLTIDAPTNLAGFTAYVMVAHYYDYPDLFNDRMTEAYLDLLRHYADIPFDGTALDEFGYMMVTVQKGQTFRCRFYGHAFAAEYQKRTGFPLDRALFDMRFAPEGKPDVRIRAINNYFEVFRDGPLRVENAFYKTSKQIFGPNTFAGDHSTFHNHMGSDDVWRCRFDWWNIPREYGQSDENWPMPERMGLIMTHPEPVTFDMYYGRLNGFLQHAFNEARFGGRTDYHGWNDWTGRWGIDLSETEKYPEIRNAELKIRLLNHFDPPAPKLSVLVVFGMPALLNWFPDETARSTWDINGNLGIEQKVQAMWKAGYPCALLPSDFIDSGQITFDSNNHPVINGHKFDSLVFLYPQYAKETTLQFLERFTRRGGKLMLEGDAGYNFNGQEISRRFQKIASRATVRGFDLNQLPTLGARTNSLPDAAFMEDGSVVFTDYATWRKNQNHPFHVTLAGHEFSGNYNGVCALKTDKAARVEKFVCGGFTELKRDGKPLFSLDLPADTVITRAASGEYNALIVGSETNHLKIY